MRRRVLRQNNLINRLRLDAVFISRTHATMASRVKVKEGRIVDAIWSRWGDDYVYEGCPLLLQDGNICSLVIGDGEVAYRHVIAGTAVAMCVVQKEEESPCFGPCLDFH